ncbi:MAG: retroviral-like aspartic protease family protein [Dehalococcoidia bacterium]
MVADRSKTLRIPRRGEDVGFVTGEVRLENALDVLGVAPSGWGPARERQMDLDILFDTGASSICLPASVIAKLRLPVQDTVAIRTARGIGEARVFGLLRVTIGGRSRIVNCLELPDDARPLFGVVEMQALGVAIDVDAERFELLPDSGADTYILA